MNLNESNTDLSNVRIHVDVTVPRFGLWSLWSLGMLFGWTVSLPLNIATGTLCVLFAGMSVLSAQQVIRDVTRNLRVTVTDREAC